MTTNYTERKSYLKFNDTQHLLYLNESPTTFVMQESNEQVTGFAYTGDMADGSTIIEATDVTDDNRRDKYIAGLIGKRYSMDAQFAILANGTSTPELVREFSEFQAYRNECKQQIDELLNR
jgi:hypothetical protein